MKRTHKLLSPLRLVSRREFLGVNAVAYMIVGLSYLLDSTPSRRAGMAWLPDYLSPQILSVLWITASIVAAVAAIVGRAQIQGWGFFSLIFPPTLWSIIFFVSWILGQAPNGYISTTSYGIIAYAAFSMSGRDDVHRDAPVQTSEGKESEQ